MNSGAFVFQFSTYIRNVKSSERAELNLSTYVLNKHFLFKTECNCYMNKRPNYYRCVQFFYEVSVKIKLQIFFTLNCTFSSLSLVNYKVPYKFARSAVVTPMNRLGKEYG